MALNRPQRHLTQPPLKALDASRGDSVATPDLWSCFKQTVATHGDRKAIITTEQSTSFAAWYARSAGFRHAYRQFALGQGDRVLLLNQNSPGIAAAITAAWAEGVIAVLVDESATAAQLDNAIAVTEPSAIVIDSSEFPLDFTPDIPVIVADAIGYETMPPDGPVTSANDFASIVFTSGSTGLPKGVVQSHGNLIRGCQAVATYANLTERDRILCLVPWSFDYGFGQLLTSIVLGASIAIPHPVTPSGICKALETQRPTVVGGISSAYAYLVGGMSPIEDTDRSSVRLIMNTGGPVPEVVVDRLDELFGDAEILLNYGLTESYRSCYLPPGLIKERRGSLGLPVPGVDIVIVDEDGCPVSTGQEGEIVHRGDFIFHGYWNDPVATSRALRRDPLSSNRAQESDRALYTGDLGYKDADGFIYFTGRRDRQLKSMGVRVSPGEVEDVLHQSGLVTQVAVFGVTHDLFGHEIWAAVVPVPGCSDTRSALQRFARNAMTRYMQPRRYLFYEALPATNSGKVDYEALRADAAESPTPSPLLS